MSPPTSHAPSYFTPSVHITGCGSIKYVPSNTTTTLPVPLNRERTSNSQRRSGPMVLVLSFVAIVVVMALMWLGAEGVLQLYYTLWSTCYSAKKNKKKTGNTKRWFSSSHGAVHPTQPGVFSPRNPSDPWLRPVHDITGALGRLVHAWSRVWSTSTGLRARLALIVVRFLAFPPSTDWPFSDPQKLPQNKTD